MFQKNLIAVVLILIAVLLSACGGIDESVEGAKDSDKLVLRFAHFLPENTAIHESVVKFKKELEERSDGWIELDIYSEGILGNEPDIMQQLQEGSVDAAFISTGELANHSDDFAVWNMPFLIKNHEAGKEIAESDEALALFDTLDSVKGLGYIYAGMRYILTIDEPYTEISDIQSLSLRHLPSPVITDWYSKLGVSSVPIPQPEVYTSFQTGVIDAIDTELDIIFAHSLYEIGNYITPVNQLLHGGILLNEERWNSLSEEEQQIFIDSMKATLEYNIQFSKDREEELVEQAIEEYDLKYYEIGDLEYMMEIANDFYEEYASKSELMKNFIDFASEVNKSAQ